MIISRGRPARLAGPPDQPRVPSPGRNRALALPPTGRLSTASADEKVHSSARVLLSLDTRPVVTENNNVVAPRLHHRVYVIRLVNPRGDGRDGYYVGMTGLPLDERFANHKHGYKSAAIVRRCGLELAWELFEGIPPMSYKEAALAEPTLADDLRDLGYLVYGPTNRPRVKRQTRGSKRRWVGRARKP
jgi:hypothetical protein